MALARRQARSPDQQRHRQLFERLLAGPVGLTTEDMAQYWADIEVGILGQLNIHCMREFLLFALSGGG